MSKEFTIKTTYEFEEFRNYINGELYDYIVKNLDFKAFDVKIEKHNEKKTPPQLKGFYRLCEHIAPFLHEMNQEVWDKDRVKLLICLRARYVEIFKGIATPKSLKKATKDELSTIINELIVFGNELDIPDCVITSREQKEFDDYYK